MVPHHHQNDIVYFNGSWDRDTFTEGEMRFHNGASYKGQLDNLKYVSGGTYTFPDGLQYMGEFRDQQIHGRGSIGGDDIAVYRNGAGPGLEL